MEYKSDTTLSGTKRVNANQLQNGDIILNDDGSYHSTVYDVYRDSDGVWLEDGLTMGYLDEYTQFLIEWD